MEINIQTIKDWIFKRSALEKRNYYGELRGRKEGEKRIVTQEQETKVKQEILDKTPEDVDLGAALWTRRTVQALITKETTKKLPLNTVGNHLFRWGLTAQRPGKYAHGQDKEAIRIWKEETYSKIVQEAKKEKAIIKFSDEAGISLNTYYGKTCALKGKTPQLRLPSKRAHISMISSVSNGGLLEFTLYTGGLNSDLFIDFLKKQIRYTTKKVYLIVDNLQVHKSKKVLAWAEDHKGKISLFFPTTVCPTIQSNRVTQ